LHLLLKLIASSDGDLVAESLTVVRHLIQQDPQSHVQTVIRLAKNLDKAKHPQARASIIWLVGEFADVNGEDNIAADVLRILARGFADESEAAKLQIVLLAAKVYVHHLNRTEQKERTVAETQTATFQRDFEDVGGFESLTGKQEMQASGHAAQSEHPIVMLWQYILLLARYDTSYDLRDRTRLYKALLAIPSSTQLASLLLLAPKPVPHTPSPSEARKDFMLGTASLVVGDVGGLHGLRGYEALPDWVEAGMEPDPTLRDELVATAEYRENREVAASDRLDVAIREGKAREKATERTNGLGSKEKTLDDWLAEDDDEGDNEDDEEEEEDSEETEEESSEGEYEDESEEEEEHDRLVK
jgi:hypothetical protein